MTHFFRRREPKSDPSRNASSSSVWNPVTSSVPDYLPRGRQGHSQVDQRGTLEDCRLNKCYEVPTYPPSVCKKRSPAYGGNYPYYSRYGIVDPRESSYHYHFPYQASQTYTWPQVFYRPSAPSYRFRAKPGQNSCTSSHCSLLANNESSQLPVKRSREPQYQTRFVDRCTAGRCSEYCDMPPQSAYCLGPESYSASYRKDTYSYSPYYNVRNAVDIAAPYPSGSHSAGNSPRFSRPAFRPCCPAIEQSFNESCSCQPLPDSCRACELQGYRPPLTARKSWPTRTPPSIIPARSYSFTGKKSRAYFQEADEGSLSDTYLSVKFRGHISKPSTDDEKQLEGSKYLHPSSAYAIGSHQSYTEFQRHQYIIPTVSITDEGLSSSPKLSPKGDGLTEFLTYKGSYQSSPIESHASFQSQTSDNVGRTPPSSPLKKRKTGKGETQSPSKSKSKKSPTSAAKIKSSHQDYSPYSEDNHFMELEKIISPYQSPNKAIAKEYMSSSRSPELPKKSSYSYYPTSSPTIEDHRSKPRRKSDSNMVINEMDRLRIESSTPPLMSGSETDDVFSTSDYSGCQFLDPILGYDSGPEVASGLDDPPHSPCQFKKVRKIHP